MIDRISKNEERLDNILDSISKLQDALELFRSNKKDFYLIKKYYGSNNWFKDKSAYENNKIPKIKAGVLSEDAVWNMFEDADELINEMQKIINDYNKKKNNI